MIVLDEQLLGRNVENKISRWYRGTVCYITDLRPESVIKDDAIPELLRHQNHPTFVTINEKDFWKRMSIDKHFCAVCLTYPDSRVQEIPHALRMVLRLPLFRTKALRMGKMIRLSDREIRYYTHRDKNVKVIRHGFRIKK